jgi:hypothetical protein
MVIANRFSGSRQSLEQAIARMACEAADSRLLCAGIDMMRREAQDAIHEALIEPERESPMAKTATKTSSKPVAKATKPKKAPAATPKAKAVAAKSKTADTPQKQKATKPRVAKPEPTKGVIKQTTDAISQLASDILADRIVPTIEQIKAVAASALGQDQTKGSRTKSKKK